ncbi:hypothetical protein EOM39_03855 [Candidatus Gracilibacteria bacterium]|nr:hypothetical protein [Candidatus Gracilibacteria bacterium]
MFNSFLLEYEKLENRWDPKAYAFLRAFGTTNFEFVKIGKLLKNNRENLPLIEDKFYKQITIKIYHKGVILRGEQKGKDIKTRPQFKVKSGQFILSKIDAKDGAFGVIPDFLDGGIITGSFVSFDIKNPKILNIDYFDLLLSQDFFLNILKSKSVGTTGRKPIMIDEFLDLEIPLPSLDIQEKIVKTYNDIKNEIEKLENENQNLDKDVDNYLMKELGIEIEKKEKKKFFCVVYEDLERWSVDSNSFNFKDLEGNYKLEKVGNVLNFTQYGLSETSNTEGIGIPFLRMNNIINGEFDYSNIKYFDLDINRKKNYLLERGDVLFNRTNSKELVGKCAVFNETGNYTFASYLIKVKVDEKLILPNYFTLLLNSKLGRKQIDSISRQITGQVNINAEELKNFIIQLPPLEIQKQILNGINMIKNKNKLNQERIEKLKVDLDEKIKGMILEGKYL